jgi:hypothetical protein
MITVPAVTPVTTPDVAFIDAMDVLLLLHVPPVVASANVLVDPTHTLVVPVIGEIEPVPTVIEVNTMQPVESV